MYRRQRHDRHQIVVPRSLIHDVIKANREPKYVALSGIKRTHDRCFSKLLVARHEKMHSLFYPIV